MSDFEYSFFNINSTIWDELVQEVQRQIQNISEIVSSEENFWRSDYTESAVSYPSSNSSTSEQVDYLLQIIGDQNETPSSANFVLPLSTNSGDDLYGYQHQNFDWSAMMPPNITPIIIEPVSMS